MYQSSPTLFNSYCPNAGDVNRLLKDTFQAMDMDTSGSLDKRTSSPLCLLVPLRLPHPDPLPSLSPAEELQKQLEKLYKMMLTVVSGKIRFIIFAKYGNYVHDNVLRPAMVPWPVPLPCDARSSSSP